MLARLARQAFCGVKEEFSHHYVIKISFGADGYYESSNPLAN
jgi:hypothetical protein